MVTISQHLSDEHRLCDNLFAEAEAAVAGQQWALADEVFSRFYGCAEHHFEEEEQVLFPAFEAATGMTQGPTEVMRLEHRQMRNVLQGLDEALAARNAEQYLGNAETLLLLMQQHNLKEESMLYRMADRALGMASEELILRMSALVGTF